MQRTPSRKEKRESKFYKVAENGNFFCTVSLFHSEAKSLIKKGFTVKRFGENEKKALLSEVSWENAFKNCVPLIVSEYVEGVIQSFPNATVENWAQELYVIAARARHNKGTNK